MNPNPPITPFGKMQSFGRIAVAGMGYAGLSVAVLLAQFREVTVVDIVPEKVRMLREGISPIRDSYVERFLQEAKEGSRLLHLSATADGREAYAGADLVIIAVPTDYDPEKNFFDCSAVEAVLSSVREACREAGTFPLVVVKSTVPVGYTARLRARYPDMHILFSPEFLRETKALYDNLYPSRIIVGCDGDTREEARQFAELLARGALSEKVETVFMGATEAEAVKLFSNTYLALRVSFFNELDTYAESKGLDTASIIRGVCLDPRIGDWYNNPSFGYGGYCLPKDTKQLLADYEGVPERLIRAIVESNRTRKEYIAERVLSLARENGPEGAPLIGVFRLAMKSGSDNFRQSSIRDVMGLLQKAGAKLLLYEPTLPEDSDLEGIPVTHDLAAFLSKCSCILANRFDPRLDPVRAKVYTRDLFFRD